MIHPGNILAAVLVGSLTILIFKFIIDVARGEYKN